MTVARMLMDRGRRANPEPETPRTPTAGAAPQYAHSINAEVLAHPGGPVDPARALSALRAIPADIERGEWLHATFAARAAGVQLEDYLEWCRSGGNAYTGDDDAVKAWESFDPMRPGGITAASLFFKARQHGWQDPTRVAGTVQPANDDTAQPGERDQPRDLSEYVASWAVGGPCPRGHTFAVGQAGGGILPLGAVTTMAAPGGFMKTACAISIAAHIASGTPWGPHAVTEGAVLVLSLEDDADECRRRVLATLQAQIAPALHAKVQSRLQLVSASGVDLRFTRIVYGSSERTGVADRVIAQVQGLEASSGVPVRLIVVDHARLAIGGDANESAHVTDMLRVLAHIAKETGAAVLILAHAPKASLNPKHAEEYNAGDVLGSGAWVDNARQAIVLTGITEGECKDFSLDRVAAKKYVAFRIIKSNYSEAGRTIYLQKTPVPGWSVAVPDVVTLAKPVRSVATVMAGLPAGNNRLLAFLASRPGQYTKNSLRMQSGKDGPLRMGEKAVAQSLASLVELGLVAVRPPTPAEIEMHGHTHQVSGVLHVV